MRTATAMSRARAFAAGASQFALRTSHNYTIMLSMTTTNVLRYACDVADDADRARGRAGASSKSRFIRSPAVDGVGINYPAIARDDAKRARDRMRY